MRRSFSSFSIDIVLQRIQIERHVLSAKYFSRLLRTKEQSSKDSIATVENYVDKWQRTALPCFSCTLGLNTESPMCMKILNDIFKMLIFHCAQRDVMSYSSPLSHFHHFGECNSKWWCPKIAHISTFPRLRSSFSRSLKCCWKKSVSLLSLLEEEGLLT